MAHHKSAIKRIRRNNRANERNSSYLSSVRTAVKKFKAAVASGSADLNPLFVSAQKIVSKAAQKGIIHRNNAARTVSRLSKLLANAGKGAGESTGASAAAAKVKAASTKKASAGSTSKKKASAKKKKTSTKK